MPSDQQISMIFLCVFVLLKQLHWQVIKHMNKHYIEYYNQHWHFHDFSSSEKHHFKIPKYFQVVHDHWKAAKITG